MKNAIHIFKKDIRRYAWAWITLAVTASVSIYLYGTTAGLMENTLNNTLQLISSVIGALLAFVLVVMVVQEESLADPNAYWITRPINRFHLLLCKLLFIVVVIFSPFIVAELIILALNDGLSLAGYAIAGIFPGLAIWMMQVFLAAQTRSLPRYLLLAVCLTVGFYLLMITLFFAMTGISDELFDFEPGLLPADMPQNIVAIIQTVYWLAAGFGILTFYYLYRRALYAWGMLVAVALFAMLLTPGETLFGFGPDWDHDVDFTMTVVSLEPDGTIHTDGEELVMYLATVEVDDIPRGSNVWVSIHNVTLTSDGEDIEVEEQAFSQLLKSAGNGQYGLRLFSVRRENLEEIDGPVTLGISGEASFSSQAEAGTLPLEEGSGMAFDGKRIAIRSFFRRDDQLSIEMAAYQPELSFMPEKVGGLFEPFEGEFSFGLLDKRDGFTTACDLGHSFGFFETVQSGQVKVKLDEDEQLEHFELVIYARRVADTTWFYEYGQEVELVLP